jgi:beta-N-acetylhexosaminidase
VNFGQLFIVGFDGVTLPPVGQRLLTEFNAAGAILFKRNIETLEQVVALNGQIVDATRSNASPAIISVDQEGGRVARLRDICTPLPPMRKLAELAQNNPTLIYRTAAMMGRELAALGFHLDFAPVADVDSNPNNPVIGDRAFSSNAKEVGRICAEFIKGLQSSGIAACAKHFPGHGDTIADSHHELPVLQHSLERLRECELVPFENAIAAGVATIMTAHVLLPMIDDVPATLSHKLLTSVLRGELRYDGLTISDDLEMKGIANHYQLRDILVKGFNAGVDLFLICSDTDKAQEAIVETQKLVDAGEIDKDKLAQSLQRVQTLKSKYVGAPAVPSLDYARSIIRSTPHLKLMEV